MATLELELGTTPVSADICYGTLFGYMRADEQISHARMIMVARSDPRINLAS